MRPECAPTTLRKDGESFRRQGLGGREPEGSARRGRRGDELQGPRPRQRRDLAGLRSQTPAIPLAQLTLLKHNVKGACHHITGAALLPTPNRIIGPANASSTGKLLP
jgi:hypothetical protein